MQESQFIELINREPDCRHHQLVYADWLEDQGDARSVLIRVSESWLEYRIRWSLVNLGVPKVASFSSFLLLKADAELIRFDNFKVRGWSWFEDVAVHSIAEAAIIFSVCRKTAQVVNYVQKDWSVDLIPANCNRDFVFKGEF